VGADATPPHWLFPLQRMRFGLADHRNVRPPVRGLACEIVRLFLGAARLCRASGTDSPDVTGIDPTTLADEAGFKRASGGSVVPGKIALQPVPLPGDLEFPVRCEALVTMPDGRGNARVPPWLASLRDGRTVLATGDVDGAVHLRDPLSRNSFGELWRRQGQPIADMTFGEDLIVVYGSLDVDVWSPIAVSGERSSMGAQVGILARKRPPAHRGRLPCQGPRLPQADPARRP
jgi:hypothetical protein